MWGRNLYSEPQFKGNLIDSPQFLFKNTRTTKKRSVLILTLQWKSQEAEQIRFLALALSRQENLPGVDANGLNSGILVGTSLSYVLPVVCS